MFRTILAAGLLAALAAGSAHAQGGDGIDCIASGRLQILRVSSYEARDEVGGLVISVAILNPQHEVQAFTISFVGPARHSAMGLRASRNPRERADQWVATLPPGTRISDRQVRSQIRLNCY
ncbi:hypothetical protein [Roseococcus sp. YIM B11640]|uniref:hypothetical protein n=1 Tax=Roseococcus sp. YIM B11640 TaxID=3133973 RepID=UPI003C7B468F